MNQPHYSIQLVWSPEDHAYIASVPELPGCKADGETPELAIAALHDAMREWIEAAHALGRDVPVPMVTEDYEKAQVLWQERLQLYIDSAVNDAVTQVMSQMSRIAAFRPIRAAGAYGGRWSLDDCTLLEREPHSPVRT